MTVSNRDIKYGDDTLCVLGADRDAYGAVTEPIYQTSNFRFRSTAEAAAYGRGESNGYIYTRYENPTVEGAEARLAMLEHGRRAFLFGSGTAATATWCYTFLRPTDRFVVAHQLYGGTSQFVDQFLKPIGIKVERIDFTDLSAVEKALPGAKACWFETPTNPTLQIVDGPAVAALCQRHGVLSAIDNTFASPINQKPLDWGLDWVMHSATKYLGGHDDVIGGALIAGESSDVDAIQRTRKSLGGVIDPQGAFLIDRGMKTLSLRVERHNANAFALAEWLRTQKTVSNICYPGLSGHPGHETAARQMTGFGGIVAFDVTGGYDAAARFVDHLKIVVNAASLGGVNSLISLPVLTSHLHADDGQLRAARITSGTVRLSVGIEALPDLKADIAAALAVV